MKYLEFLDKLRASNQARQKVWDPEGRMNGTTGKLFSATEMVGEAGEAANEVKKLVREEIGIQGSRTTVTKLGDELADVIICVDLIAARYDIDLIEAITRKFNETSRNQGFDILL